MKNTEKYQKLEEENLRLRAELDKYKQDSTSSVEKSEKRYKQLSTLSIEGVLIHEMGTIIDVNKAICDMSGYSYNELIGMNVLQLLPEKYHQKIIASMTKGYFEIFEAEGLRKNEQLIDIEVESRFTNLPSGQIMRSVVVRDIALRKKKEQELIDSEQRYRAIVESSFDGIFIYQDDKYVYANESLCKLSGYTPEEITSNGIAELVAPEDIKRVQEYAIRRAKGEDTPSSYKVKVRFKNNIYHQLLLSVRIIQYNGQYAALGAVKDITEDLKNQIALKESEDRYKAIVENSYDGIYIYQNEKFIFVNAEMAKLTGYSEKEFFSLSAEDVIIKEDIGKYKEIVQKRAIGSLMPNSFKGRIRYKDNTIHQLLINVKVINYNGKPALLGAIKDITEETKYQIALQESEEKYKAIVEKSNDGIYIYQDNGVVFANERFSQINGYSFEELKTVLINDIIHPDDKKRIIEYTEKRIKGEVSPNEYKMRIIRKNGEIRQLEASVKAISYKGKYAVLGTITDVTEKESITISLKESETRYKAIVENSYDGIYIFQNDKFIFANDKISELLGYSKKELYKFGIADIVVPKDLPRIAEHTKKRAMGEEAPDDFKATIKCKDGTILEFLISVNVIQYNGSYAVLGAIKDQTKELKYQQALAESEERYKAIVENSYDGIYIFQNDKFTYVNDRLCELSGYTNKEAMNKSIWDFIHIDDRERIQGYGKLRLLGKEVPDRYNAKIICKNKEVKNTEFHVTITKHKGELAVIGTVRDITEKEKAERALKESEAYNKVLFHDSHIPLVVMEAKNFTYIDCNQAVVDIYGFKSREEVLGKTPNDVSAPTQYNGEKSSDAAQKSISQALETGSSIFEWRHQNPDGKIWDAEVHLMRLDYNEKQYLQFSLLDITDRKIAEKALKESEAFNKVLFHDSHIPLVVMKADTYKFIDCNQAAIDIYDLKTYADVLGNTPINFSTPEQYDGKSSQEAAIIQIEEALATGSSIFEWRLQNLNGKIWDAEVHLMRLDYNEKQYLQFSLLDITDRKIAAKTLLESEERFKQLSSLSLEGLLIHKDGMIQDVNIALSKIFGYTVEEFLNIHFGKFIDKESHPVIIEAMRKQSTEPYEAVGVRKDGVKFPIELESRNITLFNGKKVRAAAVRDITERKQTEQILRESEERYKTLSDITFEGIAIHKQGIIIDVNLALAKMVGYSQEELVGQNIIELLSVPKYIDLITSKIKSNYSAPYEIEFIRKDKSTFYVEVEARDYITSEGEKARVVAYRDLTEHKRNEAKVYQQNIELKKVNAEKDKFFSIIAHDLRSPFTSIIGLSELLKTNVDYFDKNAIKQYANIINSSAVNTFKLLDNLLQWANFAGGAMQFKKEQVSLKEIFDSEIDTLEQVAHTKEIILEVNISEEISANIDVNMQRTIVRNLVSNAIKYTERNGKIEINAKLINNLIEITVSDNGVGMPAEIQNDLFKIDKTVSTVGTENENGTGLGLILCKEFIEKHNGTISCDSKLGKGSVFTYTIPI